MTSCYFRARDEPRYIRGRHEIEGCDCQGCAECTDRHCLLQWHGERGDCETHAESVCPSCLGRVRDHLAEIVRLAGLPLIEEALSKGETSEAADLLGPVADPAQWRQRANHGHVYHPDSRMGEWHPLWVLGTNDLLVTEHLGHKRTQRVGVRSSAAYLDLNLTYLAADMEFDFVGLAEELRLCREHLERVLHDGEQRETGAPCMTCRVPLRLVRADVDYWHCPRCRQRSSEEQYRFAVKALHTEAAEWLTDQEMEVRTGVKAGTVRKWAHDGDVAKRLDSGRKVYAVADVLDTARRRGLIA